MHCNRALRDAIVLLGPTGSGKSPLGEFAETAGLGGRRCLHFDFGRELRRVATAPVPPPGLTLGDTAHIRHLIATNALLEDDTFHIAEAILDGFIQARAPDPDTILLLNGLPRHASQLERLLAWLDIRLAVFLRCPADILLERIRRNTGGDREGRDDDTPAAIRRKLEIFGERTRPLIENCSGQNIPVVTVDILLHTTPDEIWPRVCVAITRGDITK